jgi:hypothetical protein
MKILKIILFFFLSVGMGINASENTEKSSRVRTDYKIDIEYQKSTHSLLVDETIFWENIDSNKIDSLFLNLPVSHGKVIDNYSQLIYKITSLKIANEQTKYTYLKTNEPNFIDSSLVKINIPNGLSKNTTLKMVIQFEIIFPDERKWSDGQFYNFENWYVTVSPMLNGKFVAYPTHNYIKSFLEFSNYDVSIKIPEEFDVALSGNYTREKKDGMIFIHTLNTSITRFNWFMFNNLVKYTNEIEINRNKIIVELFIQQAKNKYVERYIEGVKKYLKTLAKYGEYPFGRITIVDIPNAEEIENKSYPGIIAIKTELLSPIRTQKFEYDLALVIAEQYYGNMINTNTVKESWLSKGLSSYIAEKLVRKHYGDLYSYFYIAEYYPIFGLHFMSYAGIPLIYTLSEQVIPEGGRYIYKYYDNLLYANMLTPTFSLPNKKAYEVASIVKPQIALLTFEKMIGKEKITSKIKKYLDSYLFHYASVNDFLKIINDGCSKEDSSFSNELFQSDKTFDYAIRNINEYDKGNYEITVERVKDGMLPISLYIYTDVDTIKFNWNGVERFKVFNISTDNPIVSAQLDVDGNNLLDLNIANNSYVVKTQYWGSISYATRVFFWFQNALMLIGGKG